MAWTGSSAAALLLLAGCGRVAFDEGALPSVRSTLYLDRVQPAARLDGVPVPVTLDATRAYLARLDPTTLRFLDADGTELPHELETAGPPLVAWVKVPHIEGLTTELTVEYGGEPAAESPVFGTEYAGVWHMNGDGRVVADASPLGRDGDASGTRSEPGLIGTARAFTDGDCVVVRAFESVGLPVPVTLSAWMWTRTAHAAGDYDAALTKQKDVDGSDVFYLGTIATTFFGGITTMPLGTPTLFGSNEEVGAWHHVAYVFDGSQSTLYVDAAVAASGPAGGVPIASPNPLFIGCGRNGGAGPIDQWDGDYMDGMLDEVRIETVARSPQWLAYELAAQRDEVIRYGPVE